MQKAVLSIIYQSQNGHTEFIAQMLADSLKLECTEVYLIQVDEVQQHIDLLHTSDTIIFGCPTLFGNVPARFKAFMEFTDSFWYKQLWKDKLAAAFTVSSTRDGDKLNTLVSLSLFAAQHSMLWISQGILPRFINEEQTDGQNRLASYLGLMVQCGNEITGSPIHSGDALTTELFAKRILEVTLKYKNLKLHNYDTLRN